MRRKKAVVAAAVLGIRPKNRSQQMRKQKKTKMTNFAGLVIRAGPALSRKTRDEFVYLNSQSEKTTLKIKKEDL